MKKLSDLILPFFLAAVVVYAAFIIASVAINHTESRPDRFNVYHTKFYSNQPPHAEYILDKEGVVEEYKSKDDHWVFRSVSPGECYFIVKDHLPDEKVTAYHVIVDDAMECRVDSKPSQDMFMSSLYDMEGLVRLAVRTNSFEIRLNDMAEYIGGEDDLDKFYEAVDRIYGEAEHYDGNFDGMDKVEITCHVMQNFAFIDGKTGKPRDAEYRDHEETLYFDGNGCIYTHYAAYFETEGWMKFTPDEWCKVDLLNEIKNIAGIDE